ncbi:MAG: glucose-6-phosphate 1-dehydrogenase, partial [Pseudonocardiales bacterium]|nr:glucose-6-phosphate 1-dehydrogenase [Pseudonocardiales bacterium]
MSKATEEAAAETSGPGPATEVAPTPAATAPKHSEYGAEGANPLRDPSDRRLPRVPEPCVLVIFGIGGDLSRKKLIPAVYDLANRGLLPTDFAVVGFSRADWPDGGSFESLARKCAKDGARTSWNEEVWRRLAANTKFVEGTFDDDAAFDTLVKELKAVQESHGIRGNA